MNYNAILQTALAKGVGDVMLKRIITFLDTSGYSWDDLELSNGSILAESGLNPNTIQNIHAEQTRAQQLTEELLEHDIGILVENDLNYPNYLKKTLGRKCPPILFVKGNISLLNNNSVGFCGSRKVSQKGIDITASCATQLVEQGITVVSGYASGTDLSAHKAALICGGQTVFVLPEGLLRSTVKGEIKELLTEKNHVFISQFMPKITWNAGNAMKRNSVIIGLSRAMILVESGRTGGTFAAGEEALKVGCPLFVIDFAKPEVSAEANPYFISSGGHPIRGKNGIPNLKKVFWAINQDVRSELLANSVDNEDKQIRFSLS